MSVKQLAKEQRQALQQIEAHTHREFLAVMMGKNRAIVTTMTFEAYQPEWLDWWTVAELEARYKVAGHRIGELSETGS